VLLQHFVFDQEVFECVICFFIPDLTNMHVVDGDCIQEDATDDGPVAETLEGDSTQGDATDDGPVAETLEGDCSQQEANATDEGPVCEETLEDDWDVANSQFFASFSSLSAHLKSLFMKYGLQVRNRDSKQPDRLPKELCSEETVVRKKFECCSPGCKWFAWFRKRPDEKIEIRRHNFMHNHDLCICDSQESSREFASAELVLLQEFKKTKVRPVQVREFMELHFQRKYSKWKIRNYLRKDRPHEIAKDHATFADKLGEEAFKETLQYAVHANSDFVVDMIFIGFVLGRTSYIENGRYFGIDATFETNRYGLNLVTFVCQTKFGRICAIAYGLVPTESSKSYEWLFRQFKKFVVDDEPVLIISDNHPSIFSAAAKVFPSASHRVCWFHFKKNVHKAMDARDKGFVSVLSKLRRYPRRDEVVGKFRSCLRERDLEAFPYCSYLERWIPRWSDAFMPMEFIGRRNTTSNNESQHARIKAIVNSSSTLTDLVHALLKCKKDESDFVPALRTAKFRFLQGRHLTSLALEFLEDEAEKGLSICKSSAGIDKWCVSEAGLEWTYDVIENQDGSYACECGFPIRMGMPCRHVISVLSRIQKLNDVGEFCSSYWSFHSRTEIEHDVRSASILGPVRMSDTGTEETEQRMFSDVRCILEEMFKFRNEPDFALSYDALKRFGTGEVERLRRGKESRKKNTKRRKTMAHTDDGQIVCSFPTDLTSVGPSTTRRIIPADERHKRRERSALNRAYGSDFETP
jgi:hypothetical protein